MPTNADDLLSRLKSQFDILNEQRDNVFSAESPFTSEQRTAYVNAVNQALTNFLVAFNGLINANDDEVQHIADAAKAAQNTLDNALKDLTTLAGKINLVTNALGIVAKALTLFA